LGKSQIKKCIDMSNVQIMIQDSESQSSAKPDERIVKRDEEE
jgi:hypothetical protein